MLSVKLPVLRGLAEPQPALVLPESRPPANRPALSQRFPPRPWRRRRSPNLRSPSRPSPSLRFPSHLSPSRPSPSRPWPSRPWPSRPTQSHLPPSLRSPSLRSPSLPTRFLRWPPLPRSCCHLYPARHPTPVRPPSRWSRPCWWHRRCHAPEPVVPPVEEPPLDAGEQARRPHARKAKKGQLPGKRWDRVTMIPPGRWTLCHLQSQGSPKLGPEFQTDLPQSLAWAVAFPARYPRGCAASSHIRVESAQLPRRLADIRKRACWGRGHGGSEIPSGCGGGLSAARGRRRTSRRGRCLRTRQPGPSKGCSPVRATRTGTF